MAKKTQKKTAPKKDVTDISSLEERVNVLEKRFDILIDAINKSKKVKGI